MTMKKIHNSRVQDPSWLCHLNNIRRNAKKTLNQGAPLTTCPQIKMPLDIDIYEVKVQKMIKVPMIW